MRRLVASSALVVVALLAATPASADLAVGAAAPDFRLQDLDGREVALADLRGKTVVLEWINPNCPFSRRHSEAKTMAATAAKHPEVVWLGINSTSAGHRDFLAPEKHREFNSRHGIGYAVLYDTNGAVGQAYGAKTTPHMYVIDGAGTIAYLGAIDDAPSGGAASVNYVDRALGALASGARPDPTATKPYGCSVKY